ncbi:MAG: hypothetical protein GY765_10140 [bacterium]|nr:hypothetical protein [bacterium]
MDKQKILPIGIKLIIGFHILNIIIWVIGQGGAAIAYDAVAKMGLQEPRETIDPVIAVVNMGIGFGDFLIGVPLFTLAVIGLWRMRFWGVVFSWMVFGIGVYWTTVAWTKQHFYLEASVKCQPFDMGTHFMLAFAFLFSIWGSWHLFKNQELFD